MQRNSYLIISLICFAVCFALLFQGCFTKWETKDKLLFASFAGLQAVDTAQTWGTWDDPDRTELNPCIKNESGLVALKLFGTGVIYLIADWFEDARTEILAVNCGLMGGVVGWNFFTVRKL